MASPISNSSLPLAIIFERHWDTSACWVLDAALPRLAAEGYDTLCYENPHTLTQEELEAVLDNHIELARNLTSQAEELVKKVGIVLKIPLCQVGFVQLSEIMQYCVSQHNYQKAATIIKEYPSLLFFKELFTRAKQLSFTIHGVDLDIKSFGITLVQRIETLKKTDNDRVACTIHNIFKLCNRGKKVVYLGGAFHASKMIPQLQEQAVDGLVYLFPHSAQLYDQNHDDLSLYGRTPVLKGRMRLVSTREESDHVAKEFALQVRSHQRKYTQLSEKGNLTILLKHYFDAPFQAFSRSGIYEDACLDSTAPGIEKIEERLIQADIPYRYTTLHQKRFLVIPAINSEATIGRLQSNLFEPCTHAGLSRRYAVKC